ncbi:hypothetical protein GGTG_05160 [Gaeumannomyces tritici R3-111a-1]|uniref:Uncharacterized protein n=1 Tax=Gaeumannomyces tritici (strain R3-111a-1) TaxID=644352 RepID=J3NV47_GAET3|nr:hypothetical protein GGTG_05160 [Gaeumannomyces tritici R3-111a-1]EJT75223.1 hypothetical protein GGTG_05160 [Gaeumannomyces tritici R3-111a-1]
MAFTSEKSGVRKVWDMIFKDEKWIESLLLINKSYAEDGIRKSINPTLISIDLEKLKMGLNTRYFEADGPFNDK